MLQGHVIADLVVVDDAELQNLGQLSNLQMVGAVLLNGRSRQGRPRNILVWDQHVDGTGSEGN